MPYRCFMDTFEFDPEATPIPPVRVKGQGHECVHTPQPEGYMEWHEWARQASKTHAPIKCERCSKWAIWLPKAEAKAINKRRWKELNEYLVSQGLERVAWRDY
jgi:DNA mismatch repair protein MutH